MRSACRHHKIGSERPRIARELPGTGNNGHRLARVLAPIVSSALRMQNPLHESAP